MSMTEVTIDHHNALLTYIRQRIEELNLNYATVEELAGLQSGYLTKVLAEPPPKRLGWEFGFYVLTALGVKIQLAVCPKLIEIYSKRWTARRMRKPARSAPGVFVGTQDFYKALGRMGGIARSQLPKANLSAINRRAAIKRWQRVREQKVNGQKT